MVIYVQRLYVQQERSIGELIGANWAQPSELTNGEPESLFLGHNCVVLYRCDSTIVSLTKKKKNANFFYLFERTKGKDNYKGHCKFPIGSFHLQLLCLHLPQENQEWSYLEIHLLSQAGKYMWLQSYVSSLLWLTCTFSASGLGAAVVKKLVDLGSNAVVCT